MSSQTEIQMAKSYLANSGREGTMILATGANSAPAGFYISAIQILSATVVASQTAYTDIAQANLALITSIPVCIIPVKLSAINITSGQSIAYLSRI